MTTYEWSDRLESLEVSRMFIISNLHQAYEDSDDSKIAEFATKLAAIDEELNQLLK